MSKRQTRLKKGLINHYSDSSPVFSRILDALAQKPQISLSVREVMKATGISRTPTRRGLESLYERGLVERDSAGCAYLYSVNLMNPSIPLFKTFSVIQTLQPLLKKLRRQTERVVLYGACARGTDAAEDPIELFIVAHNPSRILNITEPMRINGRRLLTIIMPPSAEITIRTDDQAVVKEIEAGIVLWHDPSASVPRLEAYGGGRHKIAISTTWLKWKRSADPGRTSEPYVISMAFDSHTFKNGPAIEPFFNALPFPNVVAGDRLPMLGEGHLFYGPRDPGEFVALSIFWMEKDQGARDLGKTITELQSNKKVKKGLKAITDLAGAGLAKLMPGLQAVSTIVAEALKLNRDDEIFRTDGVYFRDTTPPFSAGTEAVLGNVFMDFNVKVISL